MASTKADFQKVLEKQSDSSIPISPLKKYCMGGFQKVVVRKLAGSLKAYWPTEL